MLDSLNKTILTPAISLLAILDEVLETSPSDAEAWGKVSEKGFETRDKLVAAVTALEGQTGMLQLEITRGQIGPKDLEKVIAKLKAMCGTLYGVTSFAVSHPYSSFFFPTTLTFFFPAVDHHTGTKYERKRLARKSHASSYCRSPKTLGTPGR